MDKIIIVLIIIIINDEPKVGPAICHLFQGLIKNEEDNVIKAKIFC